MPDVDKVVERQQLSHTDGGSANWHNPLKKLVIATEVTHANLVTQHLHS